MSFQRKYNNMKHEKLKLRKPVEQRQNVPNFIANFPSTRPLFRPFIHLSSFNFCIFFSCFSFTSLLYSKTGFVCAMFYRRNAHVTELQMGTPATRLEDACTINHFDINRLPFITLLGKGESKRFLFHCSEIDFSRPFPFSLFLLFFYSSQQLQIPTLRAAHS